MKHVFAWMTSVALSLVAPGQAQSATSALDFSASHAMALHCIETASDANISIAISIYDKHGNLMLFMKMDDVAPGFANVAKWKGRSAAIYRTSTLETATWNAPGAPDLATVEGGLPIFDDQGTALGGVGVSGASAEFDAACARSAILAVGLKPTR